MPSRFICSRLTGRGASQSGIKPLRALIQAPRSLGSAVRHHAFVPRCRSPAEQRLGGQALARLGRHPIIRSRLKSKSLAVGIRAIPPTSCVLPRTHRSFVRPLFASAATFLAAVVLSHLHGRSTGYPAEETWRLLIRSDVTALRWARRHPSTPWPAPVRLAEAHAIFSPDLGRSRARIPSSAASKEQANPPSSSTSGPAQLQRRHGIQRTHLRSNRSPDQRL